MADNYTVQVTLKGANQLSQPVQQATQSLRGLNQEATKTGNAFSQLQTIGAGLFAGVTIAGVTRMAEQLYSSGMEAQRAETLFKSFGAQLGDTSQVMDDLRRATRGVVDDVSLMEGASRLLSMGIAKNADDVTHLTSIAATFAQAMGTDVAGALEQVSLIISNESYLRLDSLGIGSGQVRELANQYKAAGMDSAAAFAQAFMDVADEKMPQMAAVADATVTEIQKLQTSMNNWWTDFGERFAQGVNGLIGIATNAGPAIYRGLFGWEPPSWAGTAETSPGSGGTIPKTPDNASAAQISGLELIDMMHNLRSMRDEGVISDAFMWGQVAAAMAAGYTDEPARGGGPARPAIAPNIADLLGGRGTAAGDFANAQSLNYIRSYGLAYAGMSEGGQFQAMQAARMRQLWSRYAGAQMEMQGLGGSSPFGMIASSADVDRAGQLLETIMQIRDTAKAIGTDEQAAVWDRMYNAAAGMAEQVGVAADRLKDMSLSQLFGQTSGGRLGEIDSAILAQMQAQGADSSTLDAMRTALGLDSGQLTQMSVQFEQDVIPQLAAIGAQYGADAMIAARTAYEAAVQQAALSGQTGPLNLPAVLGYQQYPGSGGPAGSYTVKPGDTASGIAAQFGVGVDAFGLSNPSLIVPGQTLTWGSAGGGGMVNTNFDMLEQSMMQAETSSQTVSDNMQTAVDTLSAGIEGIFGKTYQLPIELVVSGAGILGQLIAAAVNANGGTTPGSSTNTGRSNAGTRAHSQSGSQRGGR